MTSKIPSVYIHHQIFLTGLNEILFIIVNPVPALAQTSPNLREEGAKSRRKKTGREPIKAETRSNECDWLARIGFKIAFPFSATNVDVGSQLGVETVLTFSKF